MIFPNKLYTYEESVISKFPIVLSSIQDSPKTMRSIYNETKTAFSGVAEFYEVLDCLYALNKITINPKMEVLLC